MARLRAGVPRHVSHSLQKVLARTPADRHDSGASFLTSLADTARAASLEASAKSLAVLPFVNRSGEAGNHHFSDGLSEDLINAQWSRSSCGAQRPPVGPEAARDRAAREHRDGLSALVGAVREGDDRRLRNPSPCRTCDADSRLALAPLPKGASITVFAIDVLFRHSASRQVGVRCLSGPRG